MGRPFSKGILKAIKRGPGAWTGWFLANLFDRFSDLLPLAWLPAVGRSLGFLMYHLMAPRRKVALDNLYRAFGERLTPVERREILRGLSVELATTSAELASHRYCSAEVLASHISLVGEENLRESAEAGRGVILVTAHFGNFPLMLLRLCQLGYRVGVILRLPRHAPTAGLLLSKTDAWGLKVIPDKPRLAAAREALKWLSTNGILVLHMDINVSPKTGLYVPFFDQWVPTFEGPAVLSIRAGSPIHPAFIRRTNGLFHQVLIQEAIPFHLMGDLQEDKWNILLALSKRLEQIIVESPHQWWWIHRRFRRAKPKDELKGEPWQAAQAGSRSQK